LMCRFYLYMLLFFFFFSSRRRHTRFSRDWSSDVCSSDLRIADHMQDPGIRQRPADMSHVKEVGRHLVDEAALGAEAPGHAIQIRSEERRVGKECRARWEPCQ